jgi:hypothetical protein
MPAASPAATRSLPERALDVLRRAGNPFRNYFARNPDDEVCARYHVPELFSREREMLLRVVDLYRYDPKTHSEMIPVLGNKGAGKTHLLFSIKHGEAGAWQMLVTPGVYQKDTEFLEYLLFQVIDTLLGGGKQKGTRPLEFVGEELVRGLFVQTLAALSPNERLELFPAPGLGRWGRKLGLGGSQAQERVQWLLDALARPAALPFQPGTLRRACQDTSLEPRTACDAVCAWIDRTEAHNTAGMMRSQIYKGFCRAAFLGDEADLAGFLTYGFAELEFRVRPTRQDLVLALLKVMMETFRGLKIPVVVAFDQLEDLLLARRSDDAHRVAEAFFAGIVQAMHQLDGLCFLVFAERGLWNRFVPSLDGYIQDRLNNPVHVPEFGTVQALRLEAPPPDLVRRVVEQRLRASLEELPDFDQLPAIFPFTEEQVERVARTEPTLRDMLQQYRHLFDHLVFGVETSDDMKGVRNQGSRVSEERVRNPQTEAERPVSRVEAEQLPVVKSVDVIEVPVAGESSSLTPDPSPLTPASAALSPETFRELWDQEFRAAKRRLEPEGALTGATRELQAGLGLFLQVCHEHGVKVGPWRTHHVVPEWTFGDHPTYGALAIAHWVCKDGQPWKVGIGLFLGRGPAKPKDLGTKLEAMKVDPPVIDLLILLRPEDDLSLTGKSKTLWQEAARSGHQARLEAVSADSFALLSSLPRWLAALTEQLPAGQQLPNLAELIQERCERLLEQVCMPTQGN